MRERWFGATGRKVPEIALEGTVDRSFANVHFDAALAYQKKGDAGRAKSLLKTAQRLEIADAATLKKAKELQSQVR